METNNNNKQRAQENGKKRAPRRSNASTNASGKSKTSTQGRSSSGRRTSPGAKSSGAKRPQSSRARRPASNRPKPAPLEESLDLSAPINSEYDSLGFRKCEQSRPRFVEARRNALKKSAGNRTTERTAQNGAKNRPTPSDGKGKSMRFEQTAHHSSGTISSNVRKNKNKNESVKIIPIGGLNEIGKNLTVLEYQDQIMVIDCGMSFPDDDMFGIDVVIPDFTYLIENQKKIKGIVITHGHEDHIGGVPYLLNRIQVPIYGTALSIGLIKNKLNEHGLQGDLHMIHAGDTIRLGDFTVRIFRTTHSIADAICLCIDTPAARIFHTGDFKIDYTPVDGEPIDFGALAQLGKEGVDLLLADSTNATRKGFTPSEQMVRESLDGIFRDVKKRIIIATFSSNVHRVQSIIDLSLKYGRKFTVSGRSMENVMKLATELGYLKYPEGSFVELNQTRNVPDNELTIITTGSQGEPLSALARMAAGEHRSVKLKKGDTVILSSSPVPGNEKSVSNVVNKLYEREVNVIYKDVADIHVSGHAAQEDLKLMHSLIRPTFFMPVHGESRHLMIHAKLAEELGTKKDNIFILSNGDQLTVSRRRAIKFKNVVSAEDIMVDSFASGDVGSAVLKDRRMLSESGMLTVVAAIDRKTGRVVSGPEIVTRGFVYVRDNEDLMEGTKVAARKSIDKNLSKGIKDWKQLKSNVHDDLRNYIFNKTRRSPLIFPVFLEV